MGKVIVEVFPPLSDRMVKKSSGRIKFEEEIDEKDTIGNLFGRMAEKHEGFTFLYDTENKTVQSYVIVIVNEDSLPFYNGMEVTIKDGDKIAFIPEFVGG